MFGFIVTIFDTVLYAPLLNFLVFLVNTIPGHDFGIAIILLTIIIRLAIYPISVKALQSQKALQTLQPEVDKIQKQYKDDKERQARETLELYRREKVNPFSGLLLTLVQLPILIALYRVFWNGLKPEALNHLYAAVQNPGQIQSTFLGIFDLSSPNVIFAIGAGILQFFQTKMLLPKTDSKNPENPGKPNPAAMMQKQMVYVFPFLTVIILLKLPSALGLYWIASGAFSMVQQYLLLRKHK